MADGRVKAGRISEQVAIVGRFHHGAGAPQQLGDGDPGGGGDEQAHVGQHREAPAHAGRHLEQRQPLLSGDLQQDAALRIGHRGEMPAGIEAGGAAAVVEVEERGHGLGGGARLGDHHEHGPLQVQDPVQVADGLRVHVVAGEEQPRGGVRSRQGVPERRQQSVGQHLVAQIRAADAQRHHRPAAGPDVGAPLGDGPEAVRGVPLLVSQAGEVHLLVVPADVAAAAHDGQSIHGSADFGPAGQLVHRQAERADFVAGHVGVVQAETIG